jgi:uncharacterized protein
MGPWLLDVNVLLAWLWPRHEFHSSVLAWLRSHIDRGWASCPLTETGFLRIVSSPGFSLSAPTLAEAHRLLRRQMRPELGHRFWAADLPCGDPACAYLQRVAGHQQITDSYLLELAIQNRGCLVTRDKRIQSLAPPGSTESKSLLVLS